MAPNNSQAVRYWNFVEASDIPADISVSFAIDSDSDNIGPANASVRIYYDPNYSTEQNMAAINQTWSLFLNGDWQGGIIFTSYETAFVNWGVNVNGDAPWNYTDSVWPKYLTGAYTGFNTSFAASFARTNGIDEFVPIYFDSGETNAYNNVTAQAYVAHVYDCFLQGNWSTNVTYHPYLPIAYATWTYNVTTGTANATTQDIGIYGN